MTRLIEGWGSSCLNALRNAANTTTFNVRLEFMVTLTVSTIVDADIEDLIGEGLDEYNIARGGPYNHEELWVTARRKWNRSGRAEGPNCLCVDVCRLALGSAFKP